MDHLKDDERSRLEEVFRTHRSALIQFINARGAAGKAEDILLQIWRIAAAAGLDAATADLPFLYWTANDIIAGQFRKERRAENSAPDETPERLVFETLALLGPRAGKAFRRHRLDGMTCRDIALELGSTAHEIEHDLRKAYLAFARVTGRWQAN